MKLNHNLIAIKRLKCNDNPLIHFEHIDIIAIIWYIILFYELIRGYIKDIWRKIFPYNED